MKAQTKLTTVVIAINAVMAYRHVQLVNRLRRKLKLSKEDAKLLFDDMKKFLYLAALLKQELTPPSQVDEAWHHFILYTKDYDKFCHRFLGRFIHHVPQLHGAVVDEKAVKEHRSVAVGKTIKLYQEHFRDSPSKFWMIELEHPECSSCQGDD